MSEAISRLLRSPSFTSSFNRVSKSHGLGLPLVFPSPLAELNLLAVLSLLNFASGYRVPLHQETGQGAWDSIRAFCFSLYLTSNTDDGAGDFLSAKGLQAISEVTVAELMRVNVHIEKPHPDHPAITIGELGGPLYQLVKLITKVLNETGEVLVKTGYPNLGAFVAECLKAGEKARSTERPDAEVDAILEPLVKAIPGFQDMAVVNNQPVYCFKKALFLIEAIKIKFGSLSPPPFPVPSTTSHNPVFTDNVLPSLLIHLGVIDLSDSPELSQHFPGAGSPESLETLLAEPTPENVPSGKVAKDKKEPPADGPHLTNDHAYILRAAAIDACELIVEYARSPSFTIDKELEWIKDIDLPNLDMWIWAVAKDRLDYRKLKRFALRDTVFF